MNPSLLILLAAGAAVAVAVAAGSSSGGGGGELGIVQSSKDMVDIFEFYSKKMSELTPDKLETLGRLNANAKGIPFYTVEEWISMGNSTPQKWDEYKRNYFLPPGVSTEKGPDLFTEWASYDGEFANTVNFFTPYKPVLVCSEYFITEACAKGVFVDFFGRTIGTFKGNGTVYGQSDLWEISKGFGKQFKDLWKSAGGDFLKAVASVASNYPGIGTAVAVGVTFLSEVGSGASLENAALSAGRSAVPSSLQAAYDVGVGLATQGELDYEAALEVAMAAAISQGIVTGDVLERYNQIKQAYDDAKKAGVEVKGGLGGLGTAGKIATS